MRIIFLKQRIIELNKGMQYTQKLILILVISVTIIQKPVLNLHVVFFKILPVRVSSDLLHPWRCCAFSFSDLLAKIRFRGCCEYIDPKVTMLSLIKRVIRIFKKKFSLRNGYTVFISVTLCQLPILKQKPIVCCSLGRER